MPQKIDIYAAIVERCDFNVQAFFKVNNCIMFYIWHTCTLNNDESLACMSTVTMDLGVMVSPGGPVIFTPVFKLLSV